MMTELKKMPPVEDDPNDAVKGLDLFRAVFNQYPPERAQ
jgi:hypothetical protein